MQVESKLDLTPRAQRVLALAGELAESMGHRYVGTEHLALAITAEGKGVGAKALAALGVTHNSLKARVETILAERL